MQLVENSSSSSSNNNNNNNNYNNSTSNSSINNYNNSFTSNTNNNNNDDNNDYYNNINNKSSNKQSNGGYGLNRGDNNTVIYNNGNIPWQSGYTWISNDLSASHKTLPTSSWNRKEDVSVSFYKFFNKIAKIFKHFATKKRKKR